MHPSAKRLLCCLLLVAASLAALHVIGKVLFKFDVISQGVLDFVHLNEEQNLPTWFSSLQLGVAGLLCFSIVIFSHFRERPKANRAMWLALGIGFLAMSIDEFCHIHERFQMNSAGMEMERHWVYYFIIPVVVLGGSLGASAIWLLRDYRSVLRNLILGGVIFVTCSMVLEIIMLEIIWESEWTKIPGITMVEYILEEGGEMVGISLALSAAVDYLLKTLKPAASNAAS